jgi:catalase (peroxidase I)
VDHGLWNPNWALHKFHEHRNRVYKAAHLQGLPLSYLRENFELMEGLKFRGNVLLDEGINELMTLLAGTGATKFDHDNANMGVGDDPTAADHEQTGLLGAANAGTHKLYVAMDTSYPTYGTAQKATWRATFASADANFHWQEITVANGNSNDAKNLNRKAQDMGTKASGSTWVATLEITFT